MYGPDKFDEPRYSDEEIDLGKSGFGSGIGEMLGPVKAFLPYIMLIVLLAVVAFFAYDYFIGSVMNVTITIQDVEGSSLNKNSFKLFEGGNTQPLFSDRDSSSYTVQVKPGRYRYEINAAGYAIKRASLEIVAGDTTKTIELEKDLDVEIVGLESAFPERIFAGQALDVQVTLRNRGSKSAVVQLVPENDLAEFTDEISGITVGSNTTTVATFSVNVPASTAIKDKSNGDSKTAVLRIKYTKEKASANFTVLPNPKGNIKLNEASFRVKAIEGQNKQSKPIKITNSNRFPIEDLELSIEITSSTKHDPEKVKEWFQFTEVANQPEPWKINIANVPAGKSVEKELQVVVPLTADRELGIKGNIVLNTEYFDQPKKETLTLDITEKASHGIQLTLSPRQPYRINWDSSLSPAGYETKDISLNVKNTGQIDLRNVFVSIENSDDCHDGWLKFLGDLTSLDNKTIELLAVGETEELRMQASAPTVQRGSETPMYCDLYYRYDNPIQFGEYVEKSEPAFIKIEPVPE